jgi:hypothetical protein
MTFPIVGKSKRGWNLRESRLAEYGERFRSIDVLAECRKALLWCRGNPRNLKRASEMPTFLCRWLTRIHNRTMQFTSFMGQPPSPPSPLSTAEMVECLRREREELEHRRLEPVSPDSSPSARAAGVVNNSSDAAEISAGDGSIAEFIDEIPF